MAGNSSRRGAVRKGDAKKGATVGSGGQRRRGLEARGATPPATERTKHAAHRRAKAAQATTQGRPSTGGRGRPAGKPVDGPETVLGRNPVVECLRAGVPATALYIALGTESDERLDESINFASEHGIAILEVPRTDLDKLSNNGLHQGVGLQVPPYTYAHPDDLLSRSRSAGGAPLLVARATNLTRTLKDWAAKGVTVVGLDAEGQTSLDDFTAATEPVVIVVGSEGKGLSRLVREACDMTLSVPMAGPVESLNASVATGVVLAEIARRRRHA
jgi:23S rRNA (guanosine2251-2'-O)-methyltransferase